MQALLQGQLPASGSKLPNPPKIRALDVISRVFSSKCLQIHIISVSGHCMFFIFKICQTVARQWISRICLIYFLAGFCHLEPLWAGPTNSQFQDWVGLRFSGRTTIKGFCCAPCEVLRDPPQERPLFFAWPDQYLGHSTTMWTKFYPILTPNPPRVDKTGHFTH